MGRKYRNSPIIEAVCEFQFGQDSPWDLAILGLVYEKLRRTFPIRRSAKMLSVGISEVKGEFRTTDRMHFLRKDEKALVQVGQHLVSINQLKPYTSWQKFLPLIKKGVEAYREVAAPESIHRIGLRYINRIEIPATPIEMEDYFEFRPFIGAKLPQDHGPFMVGIQVVYEDSRDSLKIELSSAHSEKPNVLAATLDLDYFLVKPGAVQLDGVFKWAKVAHARIEDAFEGCITSRLRKIFREVKQ